MDQEKKGIGYELKQVIRPTQSLSMTTVYLAGSSLILSFNSWLMFRKAFVSTSARFKDGIVKLLAYLLNLEAGIPTLRSSSLYV